MPPRGLDRLRHRARRRVVADVVDRDRRAVSGQLERGRLPDSGVGAGHERAPIRLAAAQSSGYRLNSNSPTEGFLPRWARYQPAMQANDLDRDTLRRLAEAKAANGGKAISFYLNLEPTEFATPPARASAIRSLLDEGEKKMKEVEGGDADRALRADFERAREFFSGELPTDGARGLAVFCSGENDLFEVIRLPRPVQSEVVISDSPFIEPLVDLVSGTWCILLCNRRTGRIFRGSSDRIEEVARDHLGGRALAGRCRRLVAGALRARPGRGGPPPPEARRRPAPPALPARAASTTCSSARPRSSAPTSSGRCIRTSPSGSPAGCPSTSRTRPPTTCSTRRGR